MVSQVKITSSSLNTVQPLYNHQLNKRLDIKLWQGFVCVWALRGLRITFWRHSGKACLSVSLVCMTTFRLLNKVKYTKHQESCYLFDSDCSFYIAGIIQSIPNTSPPFLKSALAVIMFPSLDNAQIIDPLSRIRSVLCPSFSNPFTICYKKSISHCLLQRNLRKIANKAIFKLLNIRTEEYVNHASSNCRNLESHAKFILARINKNKYNISISDIN